MNFIIQNSLVFIAILLAIIYLAKKFFFKNKSKKSCGTDDCGCH